MANKLNIPEIRPLVWSEEHPRPDGKINGATAIDDVWVKDRTRLYIDYHVRRGAAPGTDDQWHILIQFPTHTINEKVESYEAGKIICSHYRRMFWECFYKEMMNKIFKI